MLARFEGPRGHSLLVDALTSTKMLSGNRDAAEDVANKGTLVGFEPGDLLIEQADETNDVFFLVAGKCSVVVNGRQVSRRGPGDHVGEMAALQPAQTRSASVIAVDQVVAVKLSEEDFNTLAEKYPRMYKVVAQVLAQRLLDRNWMVGGFREKTKVFIISSVEALPIARILEDAFEHDDFEVQLWTEGCFKVANYTLQDLESAVDNSDFAVAIAHGDDVTTGRNNQTWPSPRDNVIFELGLFMGRLGRERAILMEPRGSDIKLPSDFAGVTTIPYQFVKGGNNAQLMGPACNKLRNHIAIRGPNNG